MRGGVAPFFLPILEQMYGNPDRSFLDKLQGDDPDQQKALANQPPTVVATKLAEQMGAIDFVKQRGIPKRRRARAWRIRSSSKYGQATENAMQAGTVTGTPTFLINDKKLDQVVSWDQMEALSRWGVSRTPLKRPLSPFGTNAPLPPRSS